MSISVFYDWVNISKYSELNFESFKWIFEYLNLHNRIFRSSERISEYIQLQSTNLRINKHRTYNTIQKYSKKGSSNTRNEEFNSKNEFRGCREILDNRGDSTSLNERIPSPFAERNYGGQSVRKGKRWLLFVASSLCTVESTSFRRARRG